MDLAVKTEPIGGTFALAKDSGLINTYSRIDHTYLKESDGAAENSIVL